MLKRMVAVLMAVLAPLMLTSCFIAPGKFVSTLDVNRDRSFTFTYKGEVFALDLEKSMQGLGDLDEEGGEEDGEAVTEGEASWQPASLRQDAADLSEEEDDDKAEQERKNRAIADALRGEAGYRSVEYKGDGLFLIDYAITGRLDHAFVYPYNLDAEIVLPFVAIELRGNERVRVKAPAFGEGNQQSGGMAGSSASKAADRLDGTFTLTTDAEIISQNNEDGATEANGRRSVTWRATPISKDAPMAVLKLAPLPPAR